MIIVRLNTTDHEYNYKGDIEMYINEPFLCVTATDAESGNNRLMTWDKKVYDKFWLTDIKSIKGF